MEDLKVTKIRLLLLSLYQFNTNSIDSIREDFERKGETRSGFRGERISGLVLTMNQKIH